MTADSTSPLGLVEVGEGRPLIAVHGALLGGRLSFQGVAQAWSRDGRRTLIPDRPGFERTPQPSGEEPPSLDAQAARLLATMDAHGDGEPMDALGCSIGGLVLLHAVQQRPTAFRSLTLVETAAVDLCPSDMVEPAALLGIARDAHALALVDPLDGFRHIFSAVDPGLLPTVEAMVRADDTGLTPLAADIAIWESRITRAGLADAVGGDHPIGVLTVSGTTSHPAFRTFGACTAAALSGRHVVIQGAGHAAHLHPDFRPLLADHLS